MAGAVCIEADSLNILVIHRLRALCHPILACIGIERLGLFKFQFAV